MASAASASSSRASAAEIGAVPEIILGLIANSGASNGFKVAEFSNNASGDVAPIRTLNILPGVFGEDSHGDFWNGWTRYRPDGTVIGTVLSVKSGWMESNTTADVHQNFYLVQGPATVGTIGCGYTGNIELDEYAAGAYGNPKPVRSISLGKSPCGPTAIAADPSGNVYVASTASGTPLKTTITEYPARGSGDIKPLRRLQLNQYQAGTIVSYAEMTTDDAGNLYVNLHAASGNDGMLIEYSPTGDSYKRLLSEYNVGQFAIDKHGDMYAGVYPKRGVEVIDEFAPGSDKPIRSIGGVRTGLTKFGTGGGITVRP